MMMALVLCMMMTSLQAQTEVELNAWNDVNIYEINRLYPRTNVVRTLRCTTWTR